MLKQLSSKPAKLQRYLKHNKPKKRAFGKSTKKCSLCGSSRGFINKYGLRLCRRCFRDIAPKIGFKKYC
ncbi:30S ribosomal protein S14 [Candidatus Woesearchaeota archaeon CG08_land_8_20_14_0_20_47_9]|nr:MAG: 30S ribosomal protein S14 [Candidatus Woesearchaeota archaeon CG1_02_47_18]PIN73812.1 MAG: 30S ribosomal protein S14 [Candidatus Woesearchaeota archaeon CG10_big_fil_rev_8_21_14_0_10_47_5]PIO04105.1 MAG: 30S ribosomal protein S14 [Candidatus Woesearchaeota archaeon CG08_land_8_20_14_0_20_47_9]HII29787.1 30S ribosomal protein S14 [Candidatus Woesearchaeota archaeon]